MAEASARMAADEQELRAKMGPPVRISSAGVSAEPTGSTTQSGSFSAQSVIASPSGLIRGGQWNCVSVPGTPVNGDPLVVFQGFDVPNSNLQYWRNDADGGGYQSYGALFGWTGPTVPGVPYWMCPVGTDTPPPSWDVAFEGYRISPGYTITIPAHTDAPFWIQIANPLDMDLPCDDVWFSTGSGFLNWADAYNAGIVDSIASGYEGATRTYFSAGPSSFMVDRTMLQPWYGYSLLVYQPGPLDIRFGSPVAPLVRIDSTSIDQEGLLTVNYTIEGRGADVGPDVELRIDGQTVWDDSPATLGGTFVYDTCSLANGVHTIAVKSASLDYANNVCVGEDSAPFSASNFFSNIEMCQLADGAEPWRATLAEPCSWTIEVRQGGALVGQGGGTGNQIAYTWDPDASNASEGDTDITFSCSTSTGTKTKHKSVYRTSKALIPTAGHYDWAAWYPYDQLLPGLQDIWSYPSTFYSDNFGWRSLSIFNTRINEPQEFDTSCLEAFRMAQDEFWPVKVTHVTWVGHGDHNLYRGGTGDLAMTTTAWAANLVGTEQGTEWYGLSPWRMKFWPSNPTPENPIVREYWPIASAVQNSAYWDNASGELGYTQLRRRFKLVVACGCHTAQGTMPQVFGIPKAGNLHGAKCAFIGFLGRMFYAEPAKTFMRVLFEDLAQTPKVTLGQAFDHATDTIHSLGWTGPEGSYNEDPRPTLYGDPDIKIGPSEQ